MKYKCRSEYENEVVILFNEWWPDPDALQLGSPLQLNEEKAFLVNGVFGNGSQQFPYYTLSVRKGVCTRFRFIAALGEDTCEALNCFSSHSPRPHSQVKDAQK